MLSKHAKNMPLATISYQKSCEMGKRHRLSSVHLLPVSSCASS